VDQAVRVRAGGGDPGSETRITATNASVSVPGRTEWVPERVGHGSRGAERVDVASESMDAPSE